MTTAVRLVFSVDHQKRKTRSVSLPYGVYLEMVTSETFITILPSILKERLRSARKNFEAQNVFLSEGYFDDYVRHPYVRLLTGPDVYKFFCRILSLNYQQAQSSLAPVPGSLPEFFQEGNLFWNDKFRSPFMGGEQEIRDAMFCLTCLYLQAQRQQDKEMLRKKLDNFTRQEMTALEAEIIRLKEANAALEAAHQDTEERLATCEKELAEAKSQNIVVVPGDPYHMLGLEGGQSKAVPARAKALMKALHPDKSGTRETAYLFDMVRRARDAITD